MPTFSGNPFSNFFKRIAQVSQTSNTGFDGTVRPIESGDGVASSMELSVDRTKVLPKSNNHTQTFSVHDKGGTEVFTVDTESNLIKAGSSQSHVTTQIKEMGLYDFSPTQGYHYPMIAQNMFLPSGGEAFTADSIWGNGEDPATSIDSSTFLDHQNAIAVYWYIPTNITIDEIRFLAFCDAAQTLNFHLFSYDLDTSTNYGDLSNGTVHATGSVAALSTGIKTGTLTVTPPDINANKVVVGFVENVDGTGDVSVSLSIKYHYR